MPSKFRRGAVAYTANGRHYTVDSVEDGTVYCIGENGAETEFSESALLTEAEWNTRQEKRSGNIYSRLKQSRPFTTPPATKLDRGNAATVLARIEKLTPGILDFTAFTSAGRVLKESSDAALAESLSISKCRAVYDEATPEIRAGLLAALLAMAPEMLVNSATHGDNLLRALIEKGMGQHAADFEEFCDRPRS